MAKAVVEKDIQDMKNVQLEADEAFPVEQPKEYAFKLQNGQIVEASDCFPTDEELFEFIEFLRNTFYDKEANEVAQVPPVVWFKGREIQIDNVPLAQYLSYQGGSHRTIGEIVTNVMRNQRIMALYQNPESEEEFSDFVDDEEYQSLTPFEKAMFRAEKEAENELFQRVQVSRGISHSSSGDSSANLSKNETAKHESQSADSGSATPPETA